MEMREKKSKTSRRSMNILFYARMEFDGISTHSVHIHELSSNLLKLGHNLKIAEVVYSRKKKGLSFKQGSFWDRLKHLEIRLFLLTLITLLKQKTKPDVIYMRHGGLFCTGYFLAKLFRIPLVTEVNGIVIDEMQVMGHKNNILLWIVDKIERFNLSKANKIVVVTAKLKQVLQEDYKIPADKIVVIQNGANTELFKPMDSKKVKKELKLNQNNCYVCFAGTLSPHQGVEYLIKSAPLVFKKCPATQFMIVGYGKMEQELKNLSEQAGVSDKFIFTGVVPYEKVSQYINACDVCVAPAPRIERNKKSGGSSLKICEYLACEKPVVTGNIDGDKDLILEANAGYVVYPENTIELANAIIKLLKNKELREKKGKNGRKCVVENHSWEAIAKRAAAVCNEVIER
jgi:glycosyltransferase involved in cell wall biosynthesis